MSGWATIRRDPISTAIAHSRTPLTDEPNITIYETHSNRSRFAKSVVLLLGFGIDGSLATSFAHAEEFSPSDFVSLFTARTSLTGVWDESAVPKTIPAAWRIEEGTIVGRAMRLRSWHRSGTTATRI